MTWQCCFSSVLQERGSPPPEPRVTDPTRSRTTRPDGFTPRGFSTYCTEVPRAWCGVEAQQQPCDGDHVILDERLQETPGRETRERFAQILPGGCKGEAAAARLHLTW